MELDKAILQLYPDANFLPFDGDVTLEDAGDGKGPFISQWNRPEPEPTRAELDQAWIDWQVGADDRLWVEIRAERDKKLRDSDWTHISDTPLIAEKKAEWATYRQSLRNIPQDFPDPGDVVWPTEPV